MNSGTVMLILEGLFAIGMISLVLKNPDNMVKVVSGGAKAYAGLVHGLES